MVWCPHLHYVKLQMKFRGECQAPIPCHLVTSEAAAQFKNSAPASPENVLGLVTS